MKKTLDTTFVNGESVAFAMQMGFNVAHVSFYFPHRVCVERNFVTVTPEQFCKNTWVNNYRKYTAVRFTVDTTGFECPLAVRYCAAAIQETQWYPVAGHRNFWKELDLWFGQQLYGLCGLDEEVRELLEKGYSLEEALHEWDLVTDFTEKTLQSYPSSPHGSKILAVTE